MRVYQLRAVPPDRDPQVREMIGLAKGFLCDGNLSDAEVRGLHEWLVSNSAVIDTMPASSLGDGLLKALADGTIDDAERRELTAILLDVSRLTR